MMNMDEVKLHMGNILTEANILDSKIIDLRGVADVKSRRKLNRIHDAVRKLNFEIEHFEVFLSPEPKKTK